MRKKEVLTVEEFLEKVGKYIRKRKNGKKNHNHKSYSLNYKRVGEAEPCERGASSTYLKGGL